jgi:hypothetical protein
MPSAAEVEAAGEALARYGMDETTLASAGDRRLIDMMSADNRAGFLDKVHAALAAAEAVRAAATAAAER